MLPFPFFEMMLCKPVIKPDDGDEVAVHSHPCYIGGDAGVTVAEGNISPFGQSFGRRRQVPTSKDNLSQIGSLRLPANVTQFPAGCTSVGDAESKEKPEMALSRTVGAPDGDLISCGVQTCCLGVDVVVPATRKAPVMWP